MEMDASVDNFITSEQRLELRNKHKLGEHEITVAWFQQHRTIPLINSIQTLVKYWWSLCINEGSGVQCSCDMLCNMNIWNRTPPLRHGFQHIHSGFEWVLAPSSQCGPNVV